MERRDDAGTGEARQGGAGSTPPPGSAVWQSRQGAWVHSGARLPVDVLLEPGAVIADQVELGPGCEVHAGAVVYGPSRFGPGNKVFAGAVIGGAPQDSSYSGEPTRLEVGEDNVFREGVTVSRGTPKGGGLTRIGNRNYFMANSHVGHDTTIEDDCVFANGALVAGHCVVGSRVNLAGNSAVVQFATVGRLSFLGGVCGARKDLEPFLVHEQSPRTGKSEPIRLNVIGLERAGISPENIQSLKTAYRILFRDSSVLSFEASREAIVAKGALCDEVEELLEFIRRMQAGRFGRQLDKPRS